MSDVHFTQDNVPAPQAPEEKKMGFGAHIVNIFVGPGKLMRNIASFPNYTPWIAVTLIAIAASIVSIKSSPIITQEQLLLNYQQFGKQMPQTAQMDQVMQSPIFLFLTAFGSFIGIMFALALGTLIAAAITRLVSKILKGSAKFSHCFSLWSHIAVIGALGSLLTYISICVVGRNLDIFSLAALFMPQGNIFMPGFMVLSTVSLPFIWTYVLYYFGLKETVGLSVVKSVVVVVLTAVVVLLLAYAQSTAVMMIESMVMKMQAR